MSDVYSRRPPQGPVQASGSRDREGHAWGSLVGSRLSFDHVRTLVAMLLMKDGACLGLVVIDYCWLLPIAFETVYG